MSSSQITASSLSFSYRGKDGILEALKNIDLAVERGAFLSIIGPSGCGKTSFLRLIAGLEMPTGGELIIGNGDERCGFVFQAPSLFPWLNVAKNIAKPLELSGVAKKERAAKVKSVLELVGLQGFERKYPWQLSGGMQQRVSIARALVTDPDLLLMDEPFGALDEITRESMNRELYALWQRTGKTVCFVTHSIHEAVYLSSEILVLSKSPGRVVEQFASTLPNKRDASTVETKAFAGLAAKVRKALRGS